jgi:H+/Na+-translocating ferredoxin:NAD+ oxidoreductase subunit G
VTDPQASPSDVERVSPSRLLLTLGVAGALAGALIVTVFTRTEPVIRAHKAEILRAAVLEVLGDPERFDTLFVVGDSLVSSPPPGANPEKLDQLYVGYRGGQQVGVALVGEMPGFQDVIQLIFGYDPPTGKLLGMKVLESKETPGLGDKIEKDEGFIGQFAHVLAPLVGVKSARNTVDPHEVDTITGATISSQTVIRIVNQTVDRYRPLLSPEGANTQ